MIGGPYFSLERAERLLPHVRLITAESRERMEHLWSLLRDDEDAESIRSTYAAMNRCRDEWYARLRVIGAHPRRLWEVEFDSGDGYYYSWRHGEDRIGFIRRDRSARFADRHPLRTAG